MKSLEILPTKFVVFACHLCHHAEKIIQINNLGVTVIMFCKPSPYVFRVSPCHPMCAIGAYVPHVPLATTKCATELTHIGTHRIPWHMDAHTSAIDARFADIVSNVSADTAITCCVCGEHSTREAGARRDHCARCYGKVALPPVRRSSRVLSAEATALASRVAGAPAEVRRLVADVLRLPSGSRVHEVAARRLVQDAAGVPG